jgi:hypothetical protein
VAALRCEGIDAPCVFDGPINGASFKAYVEQVLAPASRPGDIVVMDNLGSLSHVEDGSEVAGRAGANGGSIGCARRGFAVELRLMYNVHRHRNTTFSPTVRRGPAATSAPHARVMENVG